MDFPPLTSQHPVVTFSVVPPSAPSAPRRRGLLVALLLSLAGRGGCDRIQRQLSDDNAAAAQSADPAWQRDSLLLSSTPTVLFRVLDLPVGRVVSPIATTTAQGFRVLSMASRGWKAFDVNYLYAGKTLRTIEDGRPASELLLKRGMWELGAQLDSIESCQRLVPAGMVDAPAGARLAIAGPISALKPVTPLSAAELQSAMATIPTLVAPSVGIGPSMLSRYTREVHTLATGNGARPSILVIYDDPEQVADSVIDVAQRPRQFVVILDKGVYGYRPTFSFKTLGNARTAPRMRWLDYVDVDRDGKAELFFGITANKKYDATVALRFENDAWRETMRAVVRCQG